MSALSTGKIAKRLGVDPKTVNNWIKAGKIPATRLPGGHYRVMESDLDRMDGLAPRPPRLLILDDPTTLFAMGVKAARGGYDYIVVDGRLFNDLTLASIVANVTGYCVVLYSTMDYAAPNLIAMPNGDVTRAIELLEARKNKVAKCRDHDADPDA